MKRRDLLKYTVWAAGTALSSPLLSSALADISKKLAKATTPYAPDFFSTKQFEVVKLLADTILPATDSPSASDVKVPETLDSLIAATFNEYEKNRYEQLTKVLESYLNNSKDNMFTDLNESDRQELIQACELNSNTVNDEVKWAYREFKQMFVNLYLNSEEIGENYLNYLPVPGYYDPCVTLESVNGKAWSL